MWASEAMSRSRRGSDTIASCTRCTVGWRWRRCIWNGDNSVSRGERRRYTPCPRRRQAMRVRSKVESGRVEDASDVAALRPLSTFDLTLIAPEVGRVGLNETEATLAG